MDYRREVDGLRALAVLPVVLFHADERWLPGGFVGVDVFFVISGFLITSILLSETSGQGLSLLRFYERRARRILPALFFVLAACIPFAWLWLPPAELADFGGSLVAVGMFVSNFFFNATSGYFETATDLKPLLHTWSLAVEEQFYLLYPLALALLLRARRSWVAVAMAAAAVVSLALAHWGAKSHVGFTYFLLPTRAWELLLGALAAWWLHGRSSPRSLQGNGGAAPGLSAHPRAPWWSAAGVAMIGVAALCFSKDTPFPSLYALLPTGGAVLVLLFAGPGNAVGRVLGSKPLVALGLVSYSAYLWHQPLFAFARHRSVELPGAGLMAGLVLLTFALAWMSWRFVEAPFRSSARVGRGAVFGLAIAGTAGFAALGVATVSAKGFPGRDPSFARLGSLQTVASSRCHNEQRKTAAQIANGNVCTLGAPVPATVAVIGDSHAGALFEALAAQAAEQGLAFRAISGGFCAPLLNGFRLDRYQDKDCQALTRAAFEHVLNDPGIRDVVLVAEWAAYTSGQRDEGFGVPATPALASDDTGSARSPADNPAIVERALALTVAQAARSGKRVFILQPTPEFARRVLPTIAKQMLFGLTVTAPTIPTDAYQTRNAEVFKSFDTLPEARIVAVHDLFCDTSLCRSAGSDATAWFSDTNHLTVPGAWPIAARLLQRLSGAPG